MKRKLNWVTNFFDEIDLIYEKAEENENIGKLLEQLEDKALEECMAAVAEGGLLATQVGAVLTPEQFHAMSEVDRETAVKMLAEKGFGGIGQDLGEGVLTVRLSPAINHTQACTIFEVLNRLEKLDGTINCLKPKWTLKLQVPLGGRKGLFQWETLIVLLYPWLSVSEVSTQEAALESSAEKPAEKTSVKPANKSAKPAGAPTKESGKKSLLSRLFKKRKA